jgi:hypothetical protein
MAFFRIYELRPVYCPITDAQIGTKAVPLPMTYWSELLAHKLAGRIERDHYENCGDSTYRVVKVGESPFWPYRHPEPALNHYGQEEIPF